MMPFWFLQLVIKIFKCINRFYGNTYRMLDEMKLNFSFIKFSLFFFKSQKFVKFGKNTFVKLFVSSFVNNSHYVPVGFFVFCFVFVFMSTWFNLLVIFISCNILVKSNKIYFYHDEQIPFNWSTKHVKGKK